MCTQNLQASTSTTPIASESCPVKCASMSVAKLFMLFKATSCFNEGSRKSVSDAKKVSQSFKQLWFTNFRRNALADLKVLAVYFS